jgi:hypothetical protein
LFQIKGKLKIFFLTTFFSPMVKWLFCKAALTICFFLCRAIWSASATLFFAGAEPSATHHLGEAHFFAKQKKAEGQKNGLCPPLHGATQGGST